MAPKEKRGAKEPSSRDTKHRYAASAVRGESVWKKEWSSFMSGVNLQTLRDGTNRVGIQASKDLQKDAEQSEEGGGAGFTFSYLFNSPAEKKQARKLKEQKQKNKKEELKTSKHQQAMKEAAEKGLKLDGMSRKERRQFLRLTISPEEKALQEMSSAETKPHELMDEKLAWYQQGPFPIDVIAEKLVRRKAEKKGKQLGLRYNFLLPHPSWIAQRVRRRKESILVSIGKRIVFDDEGHAVDPLTGEVVEPATHKPLSTTSSLSKQKVLQEVLIDPMAAAASTVRVVVRNKEAATTIKQANLSTNFLSHSLLKGNAASVLTEEEGE